MTFLGIALIEKLLLGIGVDCYQDLMFSPYWTGALNSLEKAV
jgi:hypothetical protein